MSPSFALSWLYLSSSLDVRGYMDLVLQVRGLLTIAGFGRCSFFGLEVMGMVIGAVASALYIVDAHRTFLSSLSTSYPSSCRTIRHGTDLVCRIGDLAIEAFTCLLIFKNFFSFGLTFSAYNWVVNGGIFNTFMAIASIQVVICLLSIPMCKCSPMRVEVDDRCLFNSRHAREAKSQFLSSTWYSENDKALLSYVIGLVCDVRNYLAWTAM